MNPFVYTDIFDTKGIEYLIVIGFLLLIIPFWIFLNRPVKAKVKWSRAAGALTPNLLRIPGGAFFQRNHTWAHLERSGIASIGLDDLLLHLTGEVKLKLLLEPGMKVEKGQLLARLSQDGKHLDIKSPLTGTIKTAQTSLGEEEDLFSENLYNGWLYKIQPEKWKEETRQSFLAEEAREWISGELTRFKDFLSGLMKEEHAASPGLVMQAGGELIDYPLAELDQDVWKEFQENFLNF